MKSITGYFNKLREAHAHRKQLGQQYNEALLAVTGKVDNLTELLIAPYTSMQRNGLIYAAINTDSPEVFQTVLEALANNDPNHRIIEYSEPLAYINRFEEYSLLYLAVANNKPAVALKLAEDPRTDIRFSGRTEASVYHSGSFARSGHTEKRRNECPSCLDLARDKGMHDVVKVLARREAALLQEEAAALQAEASQSPRPS